MPSASLVNWQNVRIPSLAHIDAQCAACIAAVPPNVALIEENLRGYVMLLAAHFQGFCRDLHSECVQVVANAVPPPMMLMFQTLCQQGRALNRANAGYENIKADFERFGFDLTVALQADPATQARNDGFVTRINHLND